MILIWRSLWNEGATEKVKKIMMSPLLINFGQVVSADHVLGYRYRCYNRDFQGIRAVWPSTGQGGGRKKVSIFFSYLSPKYLKGISQRDKLHLHTHTHTLPSLSLGRNVTDGHLMGRPGNG